MGSFYGDPPHHAMQVCRDFGHRGKCYLDGPESSLEYWKQEREKSQWETVLVRLKPQYKKKKKTSRQSFTHTHTHQDRKLPNYFHLPDTVPFLWSAKITQKIKNNLLVLVYHWVRGERRGWGGAAEKAEKSKCPHQHLTCGTRYPHTHEPLSHTHFTSGAFPFSNCAAGACVPVFRLLCQFGVFRPQWDLTVTCDNDSATVDDVQGCTGAGYGQPYVLELRNVTSLARSARKWWNKFLLFFVNKIKQTKK